MTTTIAGTFGAALGAILGLVLYLLGSKAVSRAADALRILSERASQTPPPTWWEELEAHRNAVTSRLDAYAANLEAQRAVIEGTLLEAQAGLNDAETKWRQARATEARVDRKRREMEETDEEGFTPAQLERMRALMASGGWDDGETAPAAPTAEAQPRRSGLSVMEQRRAGLAAHRNGGGD